MLFVRRQRFKRKGLNEVHLGGGVDTWMKGGFLNGGMEGTGLDSDKW
jgi:hypothetical protein